MYKKRTIQENRTKASSIPMKQTHGLLYLLCLLFWVPMNIFSQSPLPFSSLGYAYEKTITIDHTKISGGTDLLNFPMLINLIDADLAITGSGGKVFNASGYDIVFTDNAGYKLDHQIEYYDPTTGTYIAWIRIPVLSASVDTEIKILYGNPQISNDPSVTTVWDSHYKGVWHLDATLADFTGFGNDATNIGTTDTIGQIFRGRNFVNPSQQYIDVSSYSSELDIIGNVTISAWINLDSVNIDQKIAGNQSNTSGDGGYKMGIYTNNKFEFEIRTINNQHILNRGVSGGTVLNKNNWYYVTGMFSESGNFIKTYVNGLQDRVLPTDSVLGSSNNTLKFGKEPFGTSAYFDGRIDEIRISDTIRSDNWIKTEYTNQHPDSTFYAVSLESPHSYYQFDGFCQYDTIGYSVPDIFDSYTWKATGGEIVFNIGDSVNVRWNTALGSEAIFFKVEKGGESDSASYNVSVFEAPLPEITGDSVYCWADTTNIVFSVSNTGNTFFWELIGGNFKSGQGSYQITVDLYNGYDTIIVTETNGNGCTWYDTLAVFVNSLPDIEVSVDDTLCYDGDAVFTITNPNTVRG
ncbi:MAG: DUF2341 domain-containing protein, partial [Bacteroidales bacterium]|nr:DUF2341 domain-containing protein [Bacteroidales bacterium]